MADILQQSCVLRLNANYMRLGWSTPKEAFCMLMGGHDGAPPALALDIHYTYDEYGKPILDKMETFDRLDWEQWLVLEGRRGDLDRFVHTSKRIIRVPTVILCPRCTLMPMRDIKLSPESIRMRDGNRCQYTGVELTNSTFSLDHVIPKSKGGKDTWENLVACQKSVNYKKGDKFNHEVGLKLMRKPRAMKALPLCSLVREIKHPDHRFF